MHVKITSDGTDEELKSADSSAGSSKYSSLKILVAEDNAINQEVIQRYLMKISCSCKIANNGKEAVQLVEQEKFDLIFMDCHMPVMDGCMATKIIKDKFGNEAPIIIALTASILQEDQERARKAGMDDFLGKPVTRKKIIEIIEKYLFSEDQERSAS